MRRYSSGDVSPPKSNSKAIVPATGGPGKRGRSPPSPVRPTARPGSNDLGKSSDEDSEGDVGLTIARPTAEVKERKKAAASNPVSMSALRAARLYLDKKEKEAHKAHVV